MDLLIACSRSSLLEGVVIGAAIVFGLTFAMFCILMWAARS
jgi:hypothetical protein